MSVWNTAAYRDDSFQQIARYLGFGRGTLNIYKPFLNFEVEDFEDFPCVYGLQPGNLWDQVMVQPSIMVDIYVGPRPRVLKGLIEYLSGDFKVHVGLASVYRFFYRLHGKQRQYDVDEEGNFSKHLFELGMLAGQHSPKDALEKSQEFATVFYQHSQRLKELNTALVKVANSYSMQSYVRDIKSAEVKQEVIPSLNTKEVRMLGASHCIALKGILLLTYGRQLFVLTKVDVERVSRLLLGFSSLEFYLRVAHQYSQDQRINILRFYQYYKTQLLEAMGNAGNNNPNKLCRVMDVIYYRYLAHVASDIDKKSLDLQTAKLIDLDAGRYVDFETIHYMAKQLPVLEALEVLLVYKVLPTPDFDYFGAAKRQRDLWAQQHVIEDEVLFNEIMQHHKLLMIRAYHARHGVCPGNFHYFEGQPKWAEHYPYVHPDKIEPALTAFIDLKGAFIFAHHTTDILDLVKDKAICPKQIRDLRDERDIYKLPRKDRNQLLDYLSRDSGVDIDEMRQNMDSIFWDIRTDDKPEAKKPDGRWFMEAHTDARILVSEYEQSIADYGVYMEGYMIGKGLREKQQMMNHVTEDYGMHYDSHPIFISLDVEKWSPRMPLKVQQALNHEWAIAFGEPHLEKMHYLFTEGLVHYVKRSVHHVLPKHGNDYEGQNAKKLTFYHLAVMHTAVARLRLMDVVVGSARYAVFIDDGLLRVNVKTDNVPYAVDRIRTVMDQIWRAAGCNISWDKAFVSGQFSVFLNEIRMANRAVACGSRAILKLTNFSDVCAPTIIDDVSMVESTTRGAIVAGSALSASYFLACVLVTDLIKKYGGRHYSWESRKAVWVFSPVALGGLGFPNIMSLMGSLEYEKTQACIGTICAIAQRYPLSVPVVNRILNQPMREISTHSSVANPQTIRRQAPVCRVDRALCLVKRALTYKCPTPVLNAYRFESSTQVANVYLMAISQSTTVPGPLRELWYESSILAAIDHVSTKVLKSATARSLCPIRAMFRVAYANRNEALCVLNSW